MCVKEGILRRRNQVNQSDLESRGREFVGPPSVIRRLRPEKEPMTKRIQVADPRRGSVPARLRFRLTLKGRALPESPIANAIDVDLSSSSDR